MSIRKFNLIWATVITSIFAFTVSAHAQVIEAKDGEYVAAIISASSINRITLEDDRIKSANKSDPSFVFDHDSSTGDLFVKFLKDTQPKIIELFITSEKGKTYHLSLSPRKQPGQTVTIRNTDISKAAARRFEGKSPFKEGMAKLFKAMITRTSLKGYEVKKDKAHFQAGAELFMRRTSIYEGDAYVGSVFTVTNNSDAAINLDESKFKKERVLGVSISTNRLAPKESLTLYLVERRVS